MERRKTRGKFIALEGPDGTGKSTQALLLASFLKGMGIEAKVTREPYDPGILKALAKSESKEASCLLFAADRAIHSQKIERLLEEGFWVISDRFIDSSLAYQAGGWGMDLEKVEEINAFATSLRPDLTLIFSCPPAVCARRMQRRGKESGFDSDFLLQKKVGCLYGVLTRRGGERKIVDASQDPLKVEARVRREVKRKWRLKKR
ncbi:MAG: dTMP kinase [Aeriscardovia sp.]|nr:dTMP kinase [Aeriscardovia sp.]MBO6019233.1 dTMP kinase [Aeriscardovia sp.]